MPRIKFIFNPQSDRGDTRNKKAALEELVARAAEKAARDGQTYDVVWVTTQAPLHAADLAYEAAGEGCDVVVAMGGDGTTHEVINGLMRVEAAKRPRLGILPVGTGNDFAVSAGIPADVEEAARCLFSDKDRPVDVGRVSDRDGRHEYWINTLGFGFSGAVTVVARRSKSFLRGFALYLYIILKTILLHNKAHDLKISIDGQAPVERSTSMVNVCNGPTEGGGFPVAPHAVMDDGLISYTFMRRMNRLQMLYFLPIVLQAKHPEHKEDFELGTAKTLTFESSRPMAVHVDGELFSTWETGMHTFTAEMLPAAIHLLCPAPIETEASA